MPDTLAEVSIEEIALPRDYPLRPGVEVHAIGPLMSRLRGGILAVGPVITVCNGVEGSIALTPCRIDEVNCVNLQLDIAHHGMRVSASFALSIDDTARILERMKHPLDLARLEESAGR
jgi:hypothetical protein